MKDSKKNENKQEKRKRFERLAVYRTNEVLRKLKVLSNCGNRSAYDYSEDEVNKIFSEIERHVKDARAKFSFSKQQREFKL